MNLFRSIGFAFVLLISNATVSIAEQPATERSQLLAKATTKIRSLFERADRNQDQRLSLQEFQSVPGNDNRPERDFRLHDFDLSGDLDREEFASVTGITEPWLRGQLADPFERLVEEAIAALDESYDGWNRRPREMVNAHSFVANFLGSISFGNRRFVTGRILRLADRDADGRMSRREAKAFLEQQLGIRWFDPPLLREPTGRLLRFDHFLAADVDLSGSLSENEWRTAEWLDPEKHGEIGRWDHDQNGQLSFAEFADPTGPHYLDSLQWFLEADTNRDTKLDADELHAASDPSRRHLVASTITGFDSNHDRHLTLQEYRLSMHSCVNYFWDRQVVDQNADGVIDYNEFQFDEVDLFQLQRRYFFHRLDIDGDGTLSNREFAF